MRRRFRYDAALGRLVEVVASLDEVLPFVHGDIPAFWSPLDGTMVEGRRQYEEHMKKHNVVPFEAGSEKVTRPTPDPRPLRELIWETVDRSIQQRKRR